MKDLCSNLYHSVLFVVIWNSFKSNIFVKLKYFYYKTILNNAEFIKKKKFFFKKKIHLTY